MKVTFYAIRHQAAGVLLDTISADMPTEEQIAAAKKQHGRAGKDDWARMVEIPVELGAGRDDITRRFAAFEEPAPVTSPDPGLPRVSFKATGTVTPQ